MPAINRCLEVSSNLSLGNIELFSFLEGKKRLKHLYSVTDQEVIFKLIKNFKSSFGFVAKLRETCREFPFSHVPLSHHLTTSLLSMSGTRVVHLL
jgi:hypothetical protein